jgi:hypothetical protein
LEEGEGEHVGHVVHVEAQPVRRRLEEKYCDVTHA